MVRESSEVQERENDPVLGGWCIRTVERRWVVT